MAASPTEPPAPHAGHAGRRSPAALVAAVRPFGGSAPLIAARLLSERTGATVTVVSVWEPMPTHALGAGAVVLPLEGQPARSEVVDAVRRRLHEAVGANLEWPVEFLCGPPATMIAELARDRDAGLIVMGIGRHAPVERLLGEMTLQTVRLARLPVLAVSDDFHQLPRCIVVATDFSASSIGAAKAAVALAADDAVIYLVHVWSPSDFDRPALRHRMAAHEQRLPELFAHLQREVGAPAGVRVRSVPLVGRPVEELLAFADTHGADLIAAGSHGHGFAERLFVGGVATALLRGSPCSVLTTPPPPLAQSERAERHLYGTSERWSPEEWAVQLDGFARRNRGRRTVLEVDDPLLGAQVEEMGYALLGAAYDRRDGRVYLMLGDASDGTPRLTRSIAGVTSVAVLSDELDRDLALRLAHGRAQTLLTFAPHAEGLPPAPAARRR